MGYTAVQVGGRLMMAQAATLRVIVAAVVCGGLLSTDDVTALPVQACSALIDHVQSLVASARPLPPADLPLYLACLGVDRHDVDDDVIVRQMLSLHPDDGAPAVDRRGWSAVPGAVCATVDCLAVRAALTFEPCARLTHAQCSTLVNVLEDFTSTSSDHDEATTPSRMFDRFRLLAAAARDRKLRQSPAATADGAGTSRLAGMTGEENRSDRDTGSVSDYIGNDKMTSSRVTSGTGARRTRRASIPRGIPFRLPDSITPETQAIVESYLEWRQNNGYGRISGRWG